MTTTADIAVPHLTPELWARANRLLIRKALAEFAHERLLKPRPLGEDRYGVHSDDGTVEYRFTAALYALDHWQVDPESITRHGADGQLPLDALDFFIELRATLGLSDEILPVYLEEISSTLSGTAYKLTKEQTPAAELARAGFQAIETGMTEGHPCFVANNGRLGFGVHEYAAYAPEAAAPIRLIWLAARRDRATFTSGAGLDYETLIAAELGTETLERFAATMAARGLDLADYQLLPVHPWQWWNKLSVTFAAEVAQDRLVPLGTGDDTYLAQQSIRTFYNTTDPSKHYVKTALSVLNMGFMRGLRPRTWRRRRRSTTGWRGWWSATPSSSRPASRSSASGRRSATTTASTSGPPTATRRTARCWRRCGGRAPCRRLSRASGWRRWRRCCTSTGRGRPSRAR